MNNATYIGPCGVDSPEISGGCCEDASVAFLLKRYASTSEHLFIFATSRIEVQDNETF